MEKGFAVLALLFFAGTFSKDLFPQAAISLLRYGTWLVSSCLILYRWRSALYIASRDMFLWLVMALALLSFSWSVFPAFTLSNSREIMQMATFALYFSSRFSLKEQLQVLAWTFGIAAIISIAFVLAMPSFAIAVGEDRFGAWKGIYGHKNTFGNLMALSLLIFFLLPVEDRLGLFYKRAGFILSGCLVLLSTSKTALILSISILIMLYLYRKFRWRGKIAILLLDLATLFLGSAATLLFSNWETILTGIGRDSTLTGRTLMWGVALTRLEERIWLGFGRAAFWAPGSKYALEAGQAVSANFIPPHGHNGFIDLSLDIGLVGFIFFVISLLIAYFMALKQACASNALERVWSLAFLTFLIINNITESLLLYQTNIYWVLYSVLALSLGRVKIPENFLTKNTQYFN